MDEVHKKSSQISDKKNVYYAEGNDGLKTNPSGSVHGQLIDLVGGNNVANSLMVICSKLGMHFVACGPRELWPNSNLVETCKEIAKKTGAELSFEEDPMVATKDAHVLYTDVWVSMGEPMELWEERIKLLSPYQVNMKLIENADNNVIFLHCLPSFHNTGTTIGKEIEEKFGIKEMEVTDEVFESKYSKVFEEAENRLHTIKAVMLETLKK